MRKRGSMILVILGIVFLTAAVVLGISLCTMHTYVYTTSSGMISTLGHVYAVSPLLRLKAGMDAQKIRELREDREADLRSAILAVSAVDPVVYRDPYSPLSSQVFPLDGQIYYYRENVFDGFYCLDIATEAVRKCPFSEYSQYVHVPDEEKATVNHIGMHNFIVSNSILAEGILEHYPAMEAKLQSAGITLFPPWTYWDNGRIFFAEDRTVYEYLPEKDRLKKIVQVGKAETVGTVRDAR